MNKARRKLCKELEEVRNSKVLTYITGDRPGWGMSIGTDAVDYFGDHLDGIGVTDKITLFLYTRGGDALAAWSLINLVRLYCEKLEVIVPSKCLSAGTLMALGADKIVMTKQAMLGPIDPTIAPSETEADDSGLREPVSVEAIKGYLRMVRELGVRDEKSLADILVTLSGKVHPLVLGAVTRAESQIKMLAGRLLRRQVSDAKVRKKIVDFLCSDSGSHDYTLNRREAKDMGLAVEKPGEELYSLVRDIYKNIQAELRLLDAYNPVHYLGRSNKKSYSHPRAIIESAAVGTHRYVSEGELLRVKIRDGGGDDRLGYKPAFEGWRHETKKQTAP